MKESIKNILKNPYLIFIHLNNKRLLDWIPDELFLKLSFRAKMRKRLNLSNPTTFSEKLQWLKLNDRRPEYIMMVDKYDVKSYVASVIGDNYIIPTLGVWDKFDDIDFDLLPQQFVLKCTHDSGGLVICKNKNKFNRLEAKEKIEKCLKNNFYYHGREWPYKNVKPRIIAEKYMVDESGYDLKDYKFFCFNGVPKVMFIASDRGNQTTETKFDFYDMEFNHLPFTNGYPNPTKRHQKPEGFEEMIGLAQKLSQNIPHIRVDFYNINGKIYFGELTLYHFSGMKPFNPEEWDYTLGSWIDLPENK